MATRAGITKERIIDAAAQIANTEGLSHITAARLAASLQIKTSSLYTHITGLDEVLLGIKAKTLRDLYKAISKVSFGKTQYDALRAVADAERSYAKEHRGGVQLCVHIDKNDGPEVLSAAQDLLDAILAILRSYGMDDTDVIHAARMLRASLNGFIELEMGDGFGIAVDIDDSFRRMVDVLHLGFVGMTANLQQK